MRCFIVDHHTLPNYSPLLKKTCVRQGSVRRVFPPCGYAWVAASASASVRRGLGRAPARSSSSTASQGGGHNNNNNNNNNNNSNNHNNDNTNNVTMIINLIIPGGADGSGPPRDPPLLGSRDTARDPSGQYAHGNAEERRRKRPSKEA